MKDPSLAQPKQFRQPTFQSQGDFLCLFNCSGLFGPEDLVPFASTFRSWTWYPCGSGSIWILWAGPFGFGISVTGLNPDLDALSSVRGSSVEHGSTGSSQSLTSKRSLSRHHGGGATQRSQTRGRSLMDDPECSRLRGSGPARSSPTLRGMEVLLLGPIVVSPSRKTSASERSR